MYLGWEIFFNEKLTFKEKPTMVIKEVQEEVDQVDYMDFEAMETMLKTEGDMFAFTNEEPSDPSTFIVPTVGHLNNWTQVGFFENLGEKVCNIRSNVLFNIFNKMKYNLAYFDVSHNIEILHLNDSNEFENEVNKKLEQKIEPMEPTFETLNLSNDKNPHIIKIGSTLNEKERKDLKKLLTEFQEVFAWSYKDILGINPEIAQHHIDTYAHMVLIKQNLRRMRTIGLLKIKEEVTKQLKVGFIKPVHQDKWIANVVLVPKKGGKVRICVEFRDLNRVYPKNDFLLPYIDVLMDNTTGSALMSFMDGFLGYNQIKMAFRDMTKSTFTIEWGIYCYTVMPFGLKNVGATYQRMAIALLHDMMHNEVEVHVSDMIVKSKEREGHIINLRKFFERIKEYRLRLNSQKCTFGVTTGKFLGFEVNDRGIEVDPSMIKAILEMSPPKSEKEIRGFLGQLQYINQFITKLTSTCELIFKLLRKNEPHEWNDECQKAFELIKEYLFHPPILIPLKHGSHYSYISLSQKMWLESCLHKKMMIRMRELYTI